MAVDGAVGATGQFVVIGTDDSKEIAGATVWAQGSIRLVYRNDIPFEGLGPLLPSVLDLALFNSATLSVNTGVSPDLPGGVQTELSFNIIELEQTSIGGPSPVPLPAALPLFGTGLGIMGFIGWRRKRRMAAEAAA